MPDNSDLVTGPEQLRLDLEVALAREVDGVGMGVLKNGSTFLTIRGLSRMCGVDHAAIVRITGDWLLSPLKPREARIRELVRAQGADDHIAFIAVSNNGKVLHHAIPAPVCMAVLEYYAFEARGESEVAARSYRILARKGFNDFIYSQVGYNPSGAADVAWRQFHDRVSLTYHNVPHGYFSVFKELADVCVTLIRGGANLGSSFIPDISVGQRWAKFWADQDYDLFYGPRQKYAHSYPSYFPQSASNPQPAYCYPDLALGEFRRWIREVYLANHVHGYLSDKVRQGMIPAPAAAAAIHALGAGSEPRSLPRR